MKSLKDVKLPNYVSLMFDYQIYIDNKISNYSYSVMHYINKYNYLKI